MLKRFLSGFMFLLLFVVVLSQSVLGALDNAEIYLSFDDSNLSSGNPLDISGNGLKITNNGATTGIPAVINEGFSLDGVNDYLNGSAVSNAIGATPTEFSVSFWFNRTARTDYDVFWMIGDKTPSGGAAAKGQNIGVGSYNNNDLWYWGYYEVFTTGYTLVDDTRYHIVFTLQSGTTAKLYVNGVQEWTGTITNNLEIGDFVLGKDISSSDHYTNGVYDELAVYDYALSLVEVGDLYNSGAGYNPYESAPPTVNFTVTAKDVWDDSSILNFSLNLTRNGWASWTEYSTTTGTIETAYPLDALTTFKGVIYDIQDNGGYFNHSFSVNGASNYEADLDKLFRLYDVSYSNYSVYAGLNYTRILKYSYNYTCSSFYNASFSVFINGSLDSLEEAVCNNATASGFGFYVPGVEGSFLINTLFNTSYRSPENDYLTDAAAFNADLFAPSASLSWYFNTGFVSPSVTINLTCTDAISPINLYNLTFNTNSTLLFGNYTTGSVRTNTSANIIDGLNVAVGVCSDFFTNDTATLSTDVYVKQIVLIDELNNVPFDVSNISRARVYFEDNSSYFDFKSNSTPYINLTSIDNAKLRFDLGYLDDVTITRWVDVSLLDSSIRVCANKEGVAHYEQLIISALQKPTVLKSVFSDCVVAADYTRFAYQDAFLLKAFSVTGLYYLYTFEALNQVLLASVDGSVSSYINIDTLEFKQNAYTFNIQSDALSFSKSGATQIEIYYKNLDSNNEELNVLIYRLDTGGVVLNTSDFSDANEFTIYFDYSSFLNVTNETLFRIELLKTTSEGPAIIKRFFNINASSGSLNNGVALAISIMLTFFGLTFAAMRITFGWFGIFILIASIAVLTFAVGGVWYVVFLQAIDLIILIFIVLSMVKTGSGTVA